MCAQMAFSVSCVFQWSQRDFVNDKVQKNKGWHNDLRAYHLIHSLLVKVNYSVPHDTVQHIEIKQTNEFKNLNKDSFFCSFNPLGLLYTFYMHLFSIYRKSCPHSWIWQEFWQVRILIWFCNFDLSSFSKIHCIKTSYWSLPVKPLKLWCLIFFSSSWNCIWVLFL